MLKAVMCFDAILPSKKVARVRYSWWDDTELTDVSQRVGCNSARSLVTDSTLFNHAKKA